MCRSKTSLLQLPSINWGRNFNIFFWIRGRHFSWSSKLREGKAFCKAKGVLSILSYSVKTLNIGPAPGIEPTFRSAAKRSTSWASHRVFLELHIAKTEHKQVWPRRNSNLCNYGFDWLIQDWFGTTIWRKWHHVKTWRPKGSVSNDVTSAKLLSQTNPLPKALKEWIGGVIYVINGEKDRRVLRKRLNKLSVKKIMQ